MTNRLSRIVESGTRLDAELKAVCLFPFSKCHGWPLPAAQLLLHKKQDSKTCLRTHRLENTLNWKLIKLSHSLYAQDLYMGCGFSNSKSPLPFSYRCKLVFTQILLCVWWTAQGLFHLDVLCWSPGWVTGIFTHSGSILLAYWIAKPFGIVVIRRMTNDE